MMNKIRVILILAISISAVTLAGCSKNSDSGTSGNKLTILRSHLWILDSGKVTKSGVANTEYVQNGTYVHVKFNADNTYTVMSSYDPDYTYTYEFISPDTLKVKGTNYVIIKELTDNLMHDWQKDPGSDKIVESFYHAE